MKDMSEVEKNLKIKIYYFSATGNTKYGLLVLQKALKSVGHLCELRAIENEDAINKDDYDLLGFASPVYGGYPTENMIDFIKKSNVFDHKVPAFTVLCPCSSIGYWGSKEFFCKILATKNIHVINELGFLGNPSHPTVVGSLEKLSPKLRAFFDGIGRPNSQDERAIKEFSETLIKTYQDYSSGKKIRKLRHNSLKVWASKRINIKEKKFQEDHPILLDKEKCTQCGFCQRVCPTKAIVLDPYPMRNLDLCFSCQKCTNLCPQRAFYLKDIEKTGYYKGGLEKIKKINENYNHEKKIDYKKPLLLKFLSTGVGMVILMLIGKYTDRKIIKKDIKSSG